LLPFLASTLLGLCETPLLEILGVTEKRLTRVIISNLAEWGYLYIRDRVAFLERDKQIMIVQFIIVMGMAFKFPS